jgi:acyl-CoA thioester hydrolase
MPDTVIPENGLVISTAEVLPSWLDYNGHMNVTYFLAAFELGIDAYKAVVGLTLDYIERQERSTVALEAHITYQREASLGEQLRIETRIIDFDSKRAHVYQELYRDTDLLATQETMAISFDLASRRSAPFEAWIAANYRKLMEAQSALPRPDWVGRSIGIKKGKPGG